MDIWDYLKARLGGVSGGLPGDCPTDCEFRFVCGQPGSADRIVHCTRWDSWDAADRQIATSDLDAKSGAKRGVKSDNQEGLF